MRHCGWLALLTVGCFGGGSRGDFDGTSDAQDGPGFDGAITMSDASAASDAAIDAHEPADAGIKPDAPPPCVPRSCSDLGASCGTVPDNGCGAPLACGTCEGTATCGGQGTANVCAIPVSARECANGWCWEAPSPFAFTPTAVFARSTSDVWIIGTRGIVKHFDGTSWSAVSSNTVNDLNGIWMASATDGWIVGDGGTLRRWNGSAWTTVASGTTNDLHGVSGNAATNVWFVGDRVTKRWNGSTLSNVGTTSLFLNHVFVTAGNKVFGSSGAIIYENVSSAWTPRTSDTSGSLSFPSFSAIAGVGTNLVYGVGSVNVLAGDDYEWIWKWDGVNWTQLQDPTNPTFTDAFGDGGNVHAVTGSYVKNLATNATINPPTSVALDQVAGVGGELFAPSRQGLPWRYQNGTWTAPPHSGVNASSLSLLGAFRVGNTVWFGRYGAAVEWKQGLVVHKRPNYIDWISGTGRDNVWALDRDSFSQLSKVDHFDGQRWTQINGPGVRANAIRATAQEVLVFGAGVFRLSGTTWVAETLPQPATWSRYSDVGDDIFVVGMDYTTSPYTPRIAKRQAGVWSAMPAPPTQTVCGIAALSASNIWVTGRDRDPMTFEYSATISHWNGATWTVTKPANATDACSIVATAAGEVWVAGTGTGAVLHRATNGTWTTINGTASGDIRGLAFDGAGRLWAAGDNGVIMHR